MILFIAIATGLQTLLLEFLQTLRGLVTSKKVITAVTTCLVGFAARHNYDLPPEVVGMIFGIGAILIHAQGQADQGKEAAAIAAGASVQTIRNTTGSGGGTVETIETIETMPVPPNPAAAPASSTSDASKATVRNSHSVLAYMTLVVAVLVACGSSFTGKGLAKDALNCAAPSTKQAISDFGPAFDTALVSQVQGDGSLMKSGVEGLLSGLLTDEAKCVGLNSLAKLLTPAAPTSGVASAPLNVNHDDVAAELASMKSKLAPGREVKGLYGGLALPAEGQ